MTHDQFYAVFASVERAFHERWTAAVGSPGYVKRAWADLHNALLQAWRDNATAIGIPFNAPLVRP